MVEVAAGGTVIDQDVVVRLLARRRDPLRTLSVRELDVLALMAEGRSNAAISQALAISEVTVSTHIGTTFSQARPAAGASCDRIECRWGVVQ